MIIAIIGLPLSGKTTVFNALTKGHSSSIGGGPSGELQVGVVKVPDPRLDALSKMYLPKKTVYAEVTYWDLPSDEKQGPSQGLGGRHRNTLQAADAFLLVVRAFTNPSVHHPFGDIDPGRDLAAMLDELMLADLEVLERAVERQADAVKKSKPEERPAVVRHLDAVKKVKQGLEAGAPVRCQDLGVSEAEVAERYQLLTAKRVVAAFNVDESSPDIALGQLNLDPMMVRDMGQVSLSGRLEEDLGRMSADEEDEFRQDLGLGDPATDRVIRVSYETLGLVSFLTVGEDEVRAWSVPGGLGAQEAAGAVHSDFVRGFIRAEVIPFDDLVRCGGVPQCRREGVLRSEGKTYKVKDGDVIEFLINV